MKMKVLTAILFVFIGTLTINAQKAVTIKSFAITSDHIPSADRRSDYNGSPCALVKIQVVDDIEQVEGNTIGDIVNHGVEKWVYICKGSRNMRIHFKNHLPIRINFRDYKINGLESNRVYELLLNVPDASTTQTMVSETKMSRLQMSVSPSNAIVYIWSEGGDKKAYHPLADGTISFDVPFGRYYYKASAEGYNEVSGNMFINDEDKWENVIMSPVQGSLIVDCPTKNVEFYLNGEMLTKEKDATTWNGLINPGTYVVEARRKGYVTQSQSVVVVANQIASVSFNKLITNSAQFFKYKKAEAERKKQLKQEQKEAEKRERQNKELAMTTAGSSMVNGSTTNVNDERSLNEHSTIKGALAVICPTWNVEFYLNGKKLEKDKSSMSWNGLLEPGSYVLEARRKKYVTQVKNITVVADEVTTIKFDELITEREQEHNEKLREATFEQVDDGSDSENNVKDVQSGIMQQDIQEQEGREYDKTDNNVQSTSLQYVDLGLSVKWATCNLGASAPEEYGDYYAWGEVSPKAGSRPVNYTWNTTPYYYSGNMYSNVKFSKYNKSDKKTRLDADDDVATISLGGLWRMPTEDEIKELLTKCKWTWTTLNGKKGYSVVGPNGNTIFLPANGWYSATDLKDEGSHGSYWSSSLNANSPHSACSLYFYNGLHRKSNYYRYCGRAVRPVRP